ncbi:MAG: hypothetical protein ACW99G_02660 [Candidatus Thorarchaeota archaeon]|jgi:hypothetical protein
MPVAKISIPITELRWKAYGDTTATAADFGYPYEKNKLWASHSYPGETPGSSVTMSGNVAVDIDVAVSSYVKYRWYDPNDRSETSTLGIYDKPTHYFTDPYNRSITLGSGMTVSTDETGRQLWHRIDSSQFPQSPENRIRKMIQSRMAPAIHVRSRTTERTFVHGHERFALGNSKDIREVRARETLCRIVGQKRFSRYLRDGFVSVLNKRSRRLYQIYPGHGLTCVYEKGQVIERLCVHLKGGFAPTDDVIVRYLLAINDEDKLWELANKHGVTKNLWPDKFEMAKGDKLPERPFNLGEVFKEMKDGTYDENIAKRIEASIAAA